MVPCLETWNDLQTRRAGSLALSELLVLSAWTVISAATLPFSPAHVTR